MFDGQNIKYLVVKTPHWVTASYSCEGEEPCACIHIHAMVDQRFPYQVIVYNSDFSDSKEQYEKMKEKGYILRETDDPKTANAILQDAVKQFLTENPDVMDYMPDE